MEAFDLSLLSVLILFCIGLFTGVVAGFFGIGGGAIIVPMMIFLGNDIKVAIGISIMQMIFSSIYGTYINYKQNNLHLQDGIYIGIGGLIGASFSGIVVDKIDSYILEVLFSLFLVYSIFKFFKSNAYGGDRKIKEGLYGNLFLVCCGVIVGIFAISLGIGGGMMLAPLMAYYLGYSSKKIIPISLFFVIFSSISGFSSLALHGYVDYTQGFIVGLASLVGVRIGIYMLNRINAKKHKNALLIMYVVVLSLMLKEMLL